MKLVMHFLDLKEPEIDFLKQTSKYGATVETVGSLTTLTSEGTFEQMVENLSIGAHLNHFEVTLRGGDKSEKKKEKA